MTFSRDLLTRAFPDQPRLVGELEEFGLALDAAMDQLTALLGTAQDAADRLTTLEAEGNQTHSDILDAIADLPDEPGVVELMGGGGIQIRGVDALDDASLISRGTAISFAGKGSTADRPTLSGFARSIYFDTTLDADGKPIFWTGTAWVDSAGGTV